MIHGRGNNIKSLAWYKFAHKSILANLLFGKSADAGVQMHGTAARPADLREEINKVIIPKKRELCSRLRSEVRDQVMLVCWYR